ncbi:MAG: GspH/FimT family pseudopilin [Gammaproteobacteria bacterium]|nr:GspH/FimT family pseudopilin [Gammaproteobacteria bacterium]
MVVVLIVGIIASFAVLSIGDRALDDKLDVEARRLHQLLALAAEEADVQGLELGLQLREDGYGFLGLDPHGKWVPYEGDSLFRDRSVTEPFYLELRVDGRAVPPAERGDAQHEAKPQVFLLSSGETTVFSVDVRARGHRPYYRVESDALGRMKLERREEPA